MSVKTSVLYQGGLHCELTHQPSQSRIETDAPLDNHGKGEKFSPTDLVAAALGSCILTVMGMVAEREQAELKGSTAVIEKEMTTTSPRRIRELRVSLKLPKNIAPALRPKLEAAAHHCPVHQSLHSDIQIPIVFDWSI